MILNTNKNSRKMEIEEGKKSVSDRLPVVLENISEMTGKEVDY